MANAEHLTVLKRGPSAWNTWRASNPRIKPDLSGVNLRGRKLREINFKDVNLAESNLAGCDLSGANLTNAQLSEAMLRDGVFAGTIFYGAVLCRSDCRGAFFRWADLSRADFTGATLSAADLRRTHMARTVFKNANLNGCSVYGCAAWNVELSGASQTDLVITEQDEPEITVDNIEVAQFVYLLMNNEKIRDAIDTIGKKGVLLLGRFTDGRIVVLQRLREELRKRDFLPIVFNFAKPETKNFTETVRLLAGMSRFVIADITKPKSTPLELEAVIPECMIPFATIIEEGQKPFAMFKDLWIAHKNWVLPPIAYASVEELVAGLDKGIIDPAQARFRKLLKEKAEEMPLRRMSEVLGRPRRKP